MQNGRAAVLLLHRGIFDAVVLACHASATSCRPCPCTLWANAPLLWAWMRVHHLVPSNPIPPQHKFKGEEVDFVESYFFPRAPEFEQQLEAKRRARQAEFAAAAAAADV